MFQKLNLDFLVYVPIILISLMIHEICHGLAAYLLGDVTAKSDGRLSLNPFRHIDPIGLLLLLVIKIGWAKPVMINPHNLKKPKRDMAIIALAGPLSNVVLSILFFIPWFAIVYITPGYESNVFLEYLCNKILPMGIGMNLGLAAFNILPLPPLDGSKIIGGVMPDNLYNRYVMFDPRLGMGLLMLLSFTRVLVSVINFMHGGMLNLYLFIARFIVGLFA